VRGKRKKKLNPGFSKRASRVDQSYDEETSFSPRLKATILEVVENQIRNNNPPETRQTLERLLAAGYSRQQAIEMIGAALTEEIWNVMHDHKPYDHARFTALLDQLS
jgi:hypothetical protein